MSTSPGVQLLADSVDNGGISIVTASQDASNPRRGMIYDPVNLAAATPIYFHDLGNNDFISIFSQRWVDATQSESDPGAYTAYTADTTPSWAVVHSLTGRKDPIAGSYTIPMSVPNDSRVVTAACSRNVNFLYTLNTVNYAGMDSAVLQQFHCGNNGLFNRTSEETVPSVVSDGQDVLFDKGIYLADPYLIVVGYGKDDYTIYLARKPWGRIGSVGNWEYQTARGWSSSPDEITRVQTTSGDYLVTHGPCSTAAYKNQVCLSTVQANESTRTGKLYVAKGLQWEPGNNFPLGTVGSTYLGGLYLQPLVGASGQTGPTTFTFVTSQLSTGEGESKIITSWDVSRMSGGIVFNTTSNAISISASRPAIALRAANFATTLVGTASFSADATFNIFSTVEVTASMDVTMVKNAINTSQTYTATATSTATRGHSSSASLTPTLTVSPAVKQGFSLAASAPVTASATPAAQKGLVGSASPSATASMDVTASVNVLPFNVENFSVTNGTVPVGTSGCWVTLIGGGGTGNYTGGGGGGRVDRVWIPVAALGATYTITRGLGVYHNSGTASVFSSGSITLTAGGGIRGDSGGAGGSASAVGYTATVHNGKAGGAPGYFAPGTAGGDDSTDNVGAGGGGASYNSTPARGGNSKTRSGTAGNSHATPTAALPGDGGAGGGGNGADGSGAAAGGLFGGGGGGGATSTGADWGGIGGDGYCLVEWAA